MKTKPSFVFFGGEPLSVQSLKALKEGGLPPDLVVCNPDRPQGRKLVLTPPPAKVWALENNIPVLQPESIKESADLKKITDREWDIFIVVSYNHLLPLSLINLPRCGTINLHPSLLPKLRGPSPIRTAILEDAPHALGVTIMKLDEKMDHGPIIAQQKIGPENLSHPWPTPGRLLDNTLAEAGAKLLSSTLLPYTEGMITPREQDHEQATYTNKITKADGELNINPQALPKGNEAHDALLKVRAYDGWPGTFFYHENKRIKILEAHIEDDTFVIDTIVPEGRQPMAFDDYFRA